MVLPSQVRRPPTTRNPNRGIPRRRRSRRWPVLIVAAVVGLMVVTTLWWPHPPESATAELAASAETVEPVKPHGPAITRDTSNATEANASPPIEAPVELGPVVEDPQHDAASEVDDAAHQDGDGQAGQLPAPVQMPPVAATLFDQTLAEPVRRAATSDTNRPDQTAIADASYTTQESVETGLYRSQIDAARRLMNEGKTIDCRAALSRLLDRHGHQMPAPEAGSVRAALNEVSDRLLMSRAVVAGDPLVSEYKVQPGDKLVHIGPRHKVPYLFLMRINGIKTPELLRAGARIKVPHGPYHAIVTKSALRLDVYADGPDGRRLYVRSFKVGLGSDDSTPAGQWLVRRGKQKNPDWRNPRTNEYFSKDNPKNPIGEYWIPLRGTDDATQNLSGYGIHGTIEPSSIGRRASMGCVRLLPQDIELLYEMLTADHSRVLIRP